MRPIENDLCVENIFKYELLLIDYFICFAKNRLDWELIKSKLILCDLKQLGLGSFQQIYNLSVVWKCVGPEIKVGFLMGGTKILLIC